MFKIRNYCESFDLLLKFSMPYEQSSLNAFDIG